MRRRGVRRKGPLSKQARRETGLLYTDVEFVHCTKHPGRGFVRLTWIPHSTHKTVFLARGWICLKEEPSLTEAREEWLCRAPGQRVGKQPEPQDITLKMLPSLGKVDVLRFETLLACGCLQAGGWYRSAVTSCDHGSSWLTSRDTLQF